MPRINLKEIRAKELPEGFTWEVVYAHKKPIRTSYSITLLFRDEKKWEDIRHHPYCEDNLEAGYCDKQRKMTIEKAMRQCIDMALEDTFWWYPIVLAYYGAESIIGQVMFTEEELQPIRERYFEVYEFRRKFL